MAILMMFFSVVIAIATFIISFSIVLFGFLKRRSKKRRRKLNERISDLEEEILVTQAELQDVENDYASVEDKLDTDLLLEDESLRQRLGNLATRIDLKRIELENQLANQKFSMVVNQIKTTVSRIYYVVLLFLSLFLQLLSILTVGWSAILFIMFMVVGSVVNNTLSGGFVAGVSSVSCYLDTGSSQGSGSLSSGTLGEKVVTLLSVMAEKESGNRNPGSFLGILNDGAGGNWGTYSHTTKYTLKSLLIFLRDFYPNVFKVLEIPLDVNLDSEGGNLLGTSIDSSMAFRDSFARAGQQFEKEMREAEAIHILYNSSLPAITFLNKEYGIDLLNGKTHAGIVRLFFSIAHQYGMSGGSALYNDMYKRMNGSFDDAERFFQLLPDVAFERASSYQESIRNRYIDETAKARSFSEPFTLFEQYGTDLNAAMGNKGVSTSAGVSGRCVAKPNEVASTTQGAVVSTTVTFIGDSLLANSVTSKMIQEKLSSEIFIAKVGKHFDIDVADNPSALSVLQDEIQQNRLSEVLVIATSTNSPLSEQGIDRMLDLIKDKVKRVYLVNTVSQGSVTEEHKSKNNQVIQYALGKSDKVFFIDVVKAIGESGGPDKFLSADKVHFNEEGAKWYAELLLKEIGVR